MFSEDKRIVLKNKLVHQKKNLLNLQSEYSNISQKSIEEKLIEINCPVNQKTIVQEIFLAAKVNNSKVDDILMNG
ncbi:unnamed protein product [Macrosiphum euphorbiae]|uniref:Uncharacterized protein n=1 Tax=Macrosiphum euphorbiae TaxID=13131 RepID=A0AAV0Y873_9HEMI|nr:unnamed protein product [Macrosiphum euphorbiae]